MTCDNIDSDANVFVQNCIIFVHCAMFCLEFISVCMYVCMCASCMFILHASSACILHAVHSHSCIYLLRGVACSLGVIAYYGMTPDRIHGSVQLAPFICGP